MRSRFFWLAILSLSGFVTSFGAHIVATNLPASETVGAGAFMIGLLIAVYDFAELFAKPAAGFVADKRSMKTGAAGWSGGVHRRVVVVPGHQPSAPACCSIRPGPRGGGSLDGLDQSRRALLRTGARSRACGIYNAIKGAGYVVAPTAGGFLAHRFGFAMIFAVSAGIAAAAFALSLFLPGERGGALDDDDDLSFREALGIFTNKELAPMYAVIVINMFLVGILFGFLPVYLHGLGYSTVASGMIVQRGHCRLPIDPAGCRVDRGSV